jgi:hypothetical protein
MTADARTLLERGRALLDPTLLAHGFEANSGKWQQTASFARVAYVRDDRRLELGCRDQLTVVVYQLDDLVLTHDDYMNAVLGPAGSNMYPSFSGDPLDGFRHLQHDLANYAGTFLNGTAEAFRTIVRRSQELSGAEVRSTLYRR